MATLPPPASNPKRRYPAEPNIASPELQAWLRPLEQEYGARELGKIIGCDREAIARMIAGLHVRKGTLALAEREYERRTGRRLGAVRAVPRRRAKNAA
jgi:hypothetical protein